MSNYLAVVFFSFLLFALGISAGYCMAKLGLFPIHLHSFGAWESTSIQYYNDYNEKQGESLHKAAIVKTPNVRKGKSRNNSKEPFPN